MGKQLIPETMLQAVREFSNPDKAQAFFAEIRWPHGIACPRMGCGSAAVAYMPKVRRWYCNDCKRQFSAKVGTIFEDSPIGLDKWLPAIWLIASNRNGISSHELGRGLGVTQKTAWFMLHRIREAMQSDASDPLTGTVEADETYIGGKWENKPLRVRRTENSRSKAWQSKTAVFGIVQRGGRVRAWSVPNTGKQTLLPKLRDSIHHDATLYTDSAGLYKHVNEFFLQHAAVDHHLQEYVRGNVHTNNIECFWAVLKRTIGGTYTHVNPRHLDRYLAEQVFRFDERENDDGPRFAKATKGADGKRLTYRVLIAKNALTDNR
jgi:transposase-like protein